MSPSTPNPRHNRYTIRFRVPRPALRPDTNEMAASTPVLPSSRETMASVSSLHHHNRDFALQKYLLLQEQHESLRQHLNEIRPLHAFGSTVTTSPGTSPTTVSSTSSLSSPSPTSPYHHRYHSSFHRTSHPSGISWGHGTELETVPDETTLAEVAVEEAKLYDINEGIKRTLTELLNCEAVRSDQALRTWVQCRLMDTERELRSGRRRRSAHEP